MKARKLGKQGFDVSEVSLGCWQLGSDWGSGISEEKAFKILQTAVDNGVTFFDTADVYGNGKSEEVIGKFLKKTNAKVKVATKFGRGADAFPDKYNKDVMQKSILASIKRLGVNSLDLLQLHCIPIEELKKGDVFDWLREFKAEGLINNFGASVESVEEGLICLEQEGLLSLQVIFNIFRQKLVKDLFPKAKEKGVGIIVRLPLASGLLSGKFTKETTFNENDHRNYNKNGDAFNVGETFAGLPFEKGVELSNLIINNYLPQNNNLAQFALRWILNHKAVSCIIPGASSPDQVKANTEVSEIAEIPKELYSSLQNFYNNEVKQFIRGPY